jgi:hypothetical protein
VGQPSQPSVDIAGVPLKIAGIDIMPKLKTTQPPAEHVEFDVPARVAVDDKTFEQIVDRIEHPRPPTAAMLALLRK